MGDPGTVGGPAYEDCYFKWPSERRYLSRSGATARAKLLRSYGATVDVWESDPIVWTFKIMVVEPRETTDA